MPPVNFAERFTEFMISIMEEAKGTPYWDMSFLDILDEYEMWDWDDESEYPRIKLIDVLEDKTVFFNYGGGVVDFYGTKYNFFQIPIKFELAEQRLAQNSPSKRYFKHITGGGFWSVYRPKDDDPKLRAKKKTVDKLETLGAPSIVIKSTLSDIDMLTLKQAQNGLIVMRQPLIGTPALMYNLLTNFRELFIARKASTLVHELTHVRDVTKDKGYVSPKDDYRKYANHPLQVAAFIQESVFRLWYDLIYVNPWKWDDELKSVYHRWSLESVFEHYLDEASVFRKSRSQYLNKQNKHKVLSAMVQFLRENGFDLPSRRLYTDADFEEDSDF